MPAPKLLLAALTLSLAACRAKVEELPFEAGSSELFEGLEAGEAYAVESGTYDLVCSIDVSGNHDPDFVPFLSGEFADVGARIEVGKRRFKTREELVRLPAIEVEPGLELRFDVVDEDMVLDDPIADTVLRVGERWPARQSVGSLALTCFGLSEGREQAARAEARRRQGVLAPGFLPAGGTPVTVTGTSIRATATSMRCGPEALAAAYPKLRPSLWTETQDEVCAVDLELSNTTDAPLELAFVYRSLHTIELSLDGQTALLEMRPQRDAEVQVTLVAMSSGGSGGSGGNYAAVDDLDRGPQARTLEPGADLRLVLRGVILGLRDASRPPGIAAVGIQLDDIWTWVAAPVDSGESPGSLTDLTSP